MPEAIMSVGINQCLLEEPDDGNAASPPPRINPVAPPATEAASTSHDGVAQLVQAHATAVAANDCRAEAVSLGEASLKTAIALGAVLLSAPTEVALPLTIGRLVLEAMSLGEAAAKYGNCKDAVGKSE